MPPWLLQTVAGVVAFAMLVALIARGRLRAAIAAVIVSLLGMLAVDFEVITGTPTILVYLALLLALPNFAPLIHGAAVTATLVLAFTHGARVQDWAKIGAERTLAQDWIGAYEAFTLAHQQDPESIDLLEERGKAAWNLHYEETAMQDIAKATQLRRAAFDRAYQAWQASPEDSAKTQALGNCTARLGGMLYFHAILTSLRGDSKAAIASIDEALKHPMLMTSAGLKIAAVDLRMSRVNQLVEQLRDLLEREHPDRAGVVARLGEHLRSARGDSDARSAIIEPLPSAARRTEVDEKLTEAWKLLAEADALFGDIRSDPNLGRISSARLFRAEIDIKIGKFLRAKEELQTLLASSISTYERRKSMELLARLLEQTKAHFERAAYLKEIVELDGGNAAPTSSKADWLEALFDAAMVQTDLQPEWIKIADEYLAQTDPATKRPNREVDMRTLGWRGVAALRFEQKPELALDFLSEVYDALKLHHGKDKSILRPYRTRAFMEAVLEAALRSKRPADRESGIAYAGTLIEVCPNDAELRMRRADLLESQGRFADAAFDLQLAARHATLDQELFEKWLAVAERVKDPTGRSPQQVAQETASRAADKIATIKADDARYVALLSGTRNRASSAERIQKEIRQIVGELDAISARDPIVAWHLAQEFGRLGRTDEARNFLFRAVAEEPDVMPLRLRLGELRLDLGLYAEAARDFSHILEREPTNPVIALQAYDALMHGGAVEEARKLRLRTINLAPATAGLEFSIRAALESGRVERAYEMLGPYLGTETPRIVVLSGLVRLADKNWSGAERDLTRALEADVENPELHAGRILALAHLEDEAALIAAITKFVALPRLLPLDRVLALIDGVGAAGKHAAAAQLADTAQERWSGEDQRALRSRAVLAGFRAGDTTRLREVIDEPPIAERLDNDVVRAAFGLVMRERGPLQAGRFLQSAREYSPKPRRRIADLPLALAFSLTPHGSDVATFLTRYEKQLGSEPIPEDEAVAWWCARQRASRPTGAPEIATGVGGELQFLEGSSSKSVGSETLLDLYVRFLLFRLSGEGFEEDARSIAEKIVEFDARALTPARFVAQRIREKDGAAAASAWLREKYRALPSDFPTFRLLGELLTESDASGAELAELAETGKSLFPDARETALFIVTAALRRGSAAGIASAAQGALGLVEKDPKDIEALRALVASVRAAKDGALGAVAAEKIAASGTEDPELLAYLLECCEHPAADAKAVGVMLGPIIAAHPRFYPGARRLARAIAEGQLLPELSTLAKNVAAELPRDPNAGSCGEDIAELALTVDKAGLSQEAIALLNAGLLADPANVALRITRADVMRRQGDDAAAIADLEVLCVLAPQQAEILFMYGDVLLQERGDKLDTVLRLLPTMRRLAPEDPRLFDLMAKWHFLRPRPLGPQERRAGLNPHRAMLDQVSQDLVEALRRAPSRPELIYRAGIVAFLLGDVAKAKVLLERLKGDPRVGARAQFLTEELQP